MQIGYFGGTFDPPHLGHEILAKEAYHQLNLDEVQWLITPDPPHKTGREITPIGQRLEMLSSVTARYPEFSISDVDLRRSPPHFAADTVEIIRQEKPADSIFYIIGEDSLRDLPRWYQPTRLLNAVDRLVVVPRPCVNYDLDQLVQILPELGSKLVYLQDVLIEISSTEIRECIKTEVPYTQFLAEEVGEYIEKNRLYFNQHS